MTFFFSTLSTIAYFFLWLSKPQVLALFSLSRFLLYPRPLWPGTVTPKTTSPRTPQHFLDGTSEHEHSHRHGITRPPKRTPALFLNLNGPRLSPAQRWLVSQQDVAAHAYCPHNAPSRFLQTLAKKQTFSLYFPRILIISDIGLFTSGRKAYWQAPDAK